ncbi:hypothetical protein D3C81_1867590 [compost metagenome]
MKPTIEVLESRTRGVCYGMLGPALTLFIKDSSPAGQLLRNQRASDSRLGQTTAVITCANFCITTGLEGRFFRNEMDRAAGVVLSPQCALRTT